MNLSVVINWKSILALGASAIAIIFSLKMTADHAKEVSIHAIDAYKEVCSNKAC